MSQRPVYLTQEGYQQLKAELEYLTTVRRQEVARRLHEALGEGELIENAELEDAQREQAFVESRILTLEQMLRNAIVVEAGEGAPDVVGIGRKVTIREVDGGPLEVYHIVGSMEADPTQGKISNESPLGKALQGKRVGDKATVQAPDGTIVFEIVRIE